MAVVVNRSNSRNWGDTEAEVVTKQSGCSSRTMAAARSSCAGSIQEKRKHIAIASTPSSRSWRAACRTASSSSGTRTSPAGGVMQLGHREAVAAAHEGPVLPGDLLPDRVVLGPLVTSDVDDVAIALAGDHPGAGALVGEDRIGGDGGAVEQMPDLGRRERLALAEFAHRGQHAERGVGRGRRHLVNADVVRLGIREHDVGEGPPDIDSDELHDWSRAL